MKQFVNARVLEETHGCQEVFQVGKLGARKHIKEVVEVENQLLKSITFIQSAVRKSNDKH